LQFRKDINGLRAIAVIAVVIFHFNSSWLPGGFSGVDIFFVISGFLMTGIIFRGFEQENFSIVKFYIARVNRIVPALALLCLTLLVLGWLFLPPMDYRTLGKHAQRSIFFVSNFLYLKEAGYFDTPSYEKWLLHTWSLSVEWQFYIVYPVILAVLKKYISLNSIKICVLIGAFLGFVFCVFSTYLWPDASYYLLFSRSWEMMLGGVAFLYPFALREKGKKIIEGIGGVLIIGSYFLVSKNTPWPGYLALFPVTGTFLIIQAQRSSSLITSNTLFQYLGKWSYSIYLWHWPLVVAIYYFSLNESFIYVGIILSILFGFLSHKYIESIKFKDCFSNILRCKPLYMILAVWGGSDYIYNNHGKNIWLLWQDDNVKKTYAIMSDNDKSSRGLWLDKNERKYFSNCRFNESYLTEEIVVKLKKCKLEYGSGVLILGDSHAEDLFGMVSSRFDDKFIVGLASTMGCRPHTASNLNTQCQYDGVKEFLSKNESVFNHVIYEQAGFYLLLDKNKSKGSRAMFNKLALTSEVTGVTLDTQHIDIVTNYLSSISEFVPVTWFGSRVEPHFTEQQILQNGCDFKFELRKNTESIFNSLDQYIEKKVNHLYRLNFLSQNKVLNYQFPDDFMDCNKIFWKDTDHLSIEGEKMLGERLPKDFLLFKGELN